VARIPGAAPEKKKKKKKTNKKKPVTFVVKEMFSGQYQTDTKKALGFLFQLV
jgi:hypothetical protein